MGLNLAEDKSPRLNKGYLKGTIQLNIVEEKEGGQVINNLPP
jgi:hypothetical protein